MSHNPPMRSAILATALLLAGCTSPEADLACLRTETVETPVHPIFIRAILGPPLNLAPEEAKRTWKFTFCRERIDLAPPHPDDDRQPPPTPPTPWTPPPAGE